MTGATDIKLLPLPPKQVLDLHIPSGVRFYGHSNESMQDYARANMEPLITEIEVLQADKFDLEAALEYLKSHKEIAAMNQNGIIKALSEVRDEQGAEIHRLRARAYDLEANWSRCSRACAGEQTKREQAEARAERLAEALRDIESRHWNGVRPIQIAARVALHKHDQENPS